MNTPATAAVATITASRDLIRSTKASLLSPFGHKGYSGRVNPTPPGTELRGCGRRSPCVLVGDAVRPRVHDRADHAPVVKIPDGAVRLRVRVAGVGRRRGPGDEDAREGGRGEQQRHAC